MPVTSNWHQPVEMWWVNQQTERLHDHDCLAFAWIRRQLFMHGCPCCLNARSSSVQEGTCHEECMTRDWKEGMLDGRTFFSFFGGGFGFMYVVLICLFVFSLPPSLCISLFSASPEENAGLWRWATLATCNWILLSSSRSFCRVGRFHPLSVVYLLKTKPFLVFSCENNGCAQPLSLACARVCSRACVHSRISINASHMNRLISSRRSASLEEGPWRGRRSSHGRDARSAGPCARKRQREPKGQRLQRKIRKCIIRFLKKLSWCTHIFV